MNQKDKLEESTIKLLLEQEDFDEHYGFKDVMDNLYKYLINSLQKVLPDMQIKDEPEIKGEHRAEIISKLGEVKPDVYKYLSIDIKMSLPYERSNDWDARSRYTLQASADIKETSDKEVNIYNLTGEGYTITNGIKDAYFYIETHRTSDEEIRAKRFKKLEASKQKIDEFVQIIAKSYKNIDKLKIASINDIFE